jgi:hypothetical protein
MKILFLYLHCPSEGVLCSWDLHGGLDLAIIKENLKALLLFGYPRESGPPDKYSLSCGGLLIGPFKETGCTLLMEMMKFTTVLLDRGINEPLQELMLSMEVMKCPRHLFEGLDLLRSSGRIMGRHLRGVLADFACRCADGVFDFGLASFLAHSFWPCHSIFRQAK